MSTSTTEERRRRKQSIKDSFFDSPTSYNRYSLINVVGEGAYGVVCSATDNRTGKKVAIKRTRAVLNSQAMAVRILRELKFLRLLRGGNNIIDVSDVLIPSCRNFDDTFVVMELFPTDLHRLMKSRTQVSPDHVRYFIYQILRGVAFLHAANVFHRDLKPNNILVNGKCQIRICDFGLARAAFENTQEMVFWTDYVATRFYRAPELIMTHFTSYSTAIDIWSVGCIFGELLNGGAPMFPGQTANDQFTRITQVTGRPLPAAIDKLRNAQARDFVRSLPPQPQTPLHLLYPDTDPAALDLLQRLLEFDPDERISASDALKHPYLAKVSRGEAGGPMVEPIPLEAEDFAFERVRMTRDEMRAEFMKEVAMYHSESEMAQVHSGRTGTDQMIDEMGGLEGHFGHRSRRTLDMEELMNGVSRTSPPAMAEFQSNNTMGEYYMEAAEARRW